MTSPDSGEPDQAADVLEVLRRHCRSIIAALRAVDLQHPGATVITNRMRGGVDALNNDIAELRYLTRKGTR